jgi:phage recombination protein Bet
MFTEEEKALIWRSKANGCPDDDFALFLHMAQRTGLDPRANQIYTVRRGGKWTIQTGIDGYRLIADRTGKYAGSDDAEMIGETPDGKYPAAARVVVYKMVEGQRCPFGATARWSEYYPGSQSGQQWHKMPCVMLAKVAEALALRKAFPADLSGLYTNEEMDQAGSSEQEPPAPKAPTVTAIPAPAAGATSDQPTREPQSAGDADPSVPVTGHGKQAFGYVPMRWPTAKMFTEPTTEAQSKMSRAKARERMLDPDDLPLIRELVMRAYGVEDDGSKAVYSLFIDWLMNADDDTLDRASAAAEPLPEIEPS